MVGVFLSSLIPTFSPTEKEKLPNVLMGNTVPGKLSALKLRRSGRVELRPGADAFPSAF
jgi:hypothetical protein